MLHLQYILIAFEIFQSDVVVVSEESLQACLLLLIFLLQVVVVIRQSLILLLQLFVYSSDLCDLLFLLPNFLLNVGFIDLLTLFQLLHELLGCFLDLSMKLLYLICSI